jgi:hypothetical protein
MFDSGLATNINVFASQTSTTDDISDIKSLAAWMREE